MLKDTDIKETVMKWRENLPEPLDPEIVPLCDALNSAGFVTYTSCFGHGFQRPMVWFEHSTDERIESMSRFVISGLEFQPDLPYSVRIRKQIYKNLGDYDWSIEVNHWDIYADTTTEEAITKWAEASDYIAGLIDQWAEQGEASWNIE